MTDKITIERETLIDLIAQHLYGTYYCKRVWAAWQVGTMSEDDFEPVEESDTPGEIADAILAALAAAGDKPPAAVPPIDDMDAVAIKYAHKMALDLECILAEYGGSWYNTAMQTLGEYRSAMNAIHERESPTFMGEPVTAAGDKP